MSDLFTVANMLFVLYVILYIGAAYLIIILKKKYKKSFNFRVLTALFIGLVLGIVIQFLTKAVSPDGNTVEQTTTFLSIFGSGYVALLKLMVIPLVFVAMVSSVMNLKSERSLVKIVPKVLAYLIITVSIAAFIGITASVIFNLDDQAVNLIQNQESIYGDTSAIADQADKLDSTQQTLEDTGTYADKILSFIPSNIFYMLTGQESTATLSTVLVGMFTGYAIYQVRRRKPEKVQTFVDFIESSKEVVLSMVKEIIKLTPFGVMALMANFMAVNDFKQLSFFVYFVLASYVAIIIMYIVHLLIIFFFGLSPIHYAKKTWSTILFAFSSRSSAATLPQTIETQIVQLGVDEETANIAGTFGTSIGQNGCAGIYPAMVVFMTASATAVVAGDTFSLSFAFIVKLIAVIAVSSFGIAGVGGGATFAAVAVLTIMGYDLTFAALLVAIEPLIDMARTALNVNDSMAAGVVTSKINKTINKEQFNAEYVDIDEAL